jgi:hypothetical protein
MKNQFCLYVAAIIFCLCSGSSISGQRPATDDKEATWRGKIAPNGLVEIAGILGDIHTETTSGDEVEVVAVKRGKTSEFDRVYMQVEPSAEGLKICAAFPLLNNEDTSQCLSSVKVVSTNFADNRELHLRYNNGDAQSFRLVDVHLQLRVRVPAGTRIVARTLSGNIEAKGISAKLQAIATNGGVAASLGATDFSGPIDLKSINGSVSLTVPGEINAQVQLYTLNDGIATDLPITVSRAFRRIPLVVGTIASGTIGRGGRRISLSTVNGNVELRRAQ